MTLDPNNYLRKVNLYLRLSLYLYLSINSQKMVLQAFIFCSLTLPTPQSIYAIFATYFLRPRFVILGNCSSHSFGTCILSFKGLNLLQPVCGDSYAKYINKGSLVL